MLKDLTSVCNVIGQTLNLYTLETPPPHVDTRLRKLSDSHNKDEDSQAVKLSGLEE